MIWSLVLAGGGGGGGGGKGCLGMFNEFFCGSGGGGGGTGLAIKA